ncbi:hypothetical protein [Polyangium jinanense]|uniref:Uncharacterized protein n=1 Tax=Polyangium jinanense TaxID=2829994 RepID=A0A9X3XHN3_9BACT|nr:hypothetical protein [Polyangium jinanense]MDC3989545.1 hypothetical protein [Polyangium jinanense]
MNPFQGPETAALTGALGGAAAFVVGMGARALGTAFSARREARAARHALGEPRTALAGLDPAANVTLEGVLEVVGEPGARFEDGAPAAAATAAGRFCEANTRAARLRLVMRDGTVDLRGKTLVVAGSRETRDDSIDALPAEVAARIHAACGDRDPLPAGPLRMRSIAHGDRVVVAGKLVRAEEASAAAGYREGGAPWTLVPAGATDRSLEVLPIAFAGLPAVSGVLGAAFSRRRLRKMGPFAAQAAVFGAAICMGKASYDARAFAARVEAEAEANAQKKAEAQLGDPASCKELAGQYTSAMDRVSTCTHDNDCRATLRGDQWYDLDGCFRFENRQTSTEEADRLARAWLEARCVTNYEVCSAQPTAMCRQGRCVERPPHPVPETWTRREFARLFTFFAPPDVDTTRRNGFECGPGARITLHRHDFEASFTLGQYGLELGGSTTPVRIGSYHAVTKRMDATELAMPQGYTQGFFVAFDEKEAVCPPFCLPVLGGGDSVGHLYFQARCHTAEACEEAYWILETLAPF